MKAEHNIHSNFWNDYLAPSIFFLVSLVIVLTFATIATDVDDVIRELQIRDLLSDKNWYDMRVPTIAMPDPYYSHYSRLVDAPYVFVTRVLQPFIGQESAFAFAKFLIPLVLLAVFSICIAKVMKHLAGGKIPVLVIAITPLLLFFTILNFSPNRIDHHSFQFVAMMCLLWGILTHHKIGGYLIGCSALISVVVGLECLPFIAVAFAGLIVAAVLGDEACLQKLKRSGISLIVLSAPLGLVLLGRSGFSSVQCDAYSMPWILGSTFGGGILMGLPKLWGLQWFQHSNAMMRRGLSIVGIGAAVGLILATLFPTCLSGPYHMIDPISREFWLEPMAVEKPIFQSLATAPFVFILYMFLYLIIAYFVFVSIKSDLKKGKFGVVIIAAVALTAFCATLVQMRFMKFAFLFLTLFLTKILYDARLWSFPKRSDKDYLKRVLTQVAPLPLICALLFSLYVVSPKEEPEWNAYASMIGNDCKNADFSVLDSVQEGRIIAPLGLSLNLLPNTYGHQVAATAHHRSSPGIRNVIEVFTTTEAPLRNDILAKFDYVAVCAWGEDQMKTRDDYDILPAPLYLSLTADMEWPGLVEIPSGAKNSFRLFKIDHDQLNAVNTAK